MAETPIQRKEERAQALFMRWNRAIRCLNVIGAYGRSFGKTYKRACLQLFRFTARCCLQ